MLKHYAITQNVRIVFATAPDPRINAQVVPNHVVYFYPAEEKIGLVLSCHYLHVHQWTGGLRLLIQDRMYYDLLESQGGW
jgi:hypothetical protein